MGTYGKRYGVEFGYRYGATDDEPPGPTPTGGLGFVAEGERRPPAQRVDLLPRKWAVRRGL